MQQTCRYRNKRIHKREMEKKYARSRWNDRYSVRGLRRKLINEAQEDRESGWNIRYPVRNNGWEYWKTLYLTGARQYAKKFSDKRIRQKYRIMIQKFDPEDVPAPRGGDYEKEYDYIWTIW